jgi:hypothetical protein
MGVNLITSLAASDIRSAGFALDFQDTACLGNRHDLSIWNANGDWPGIRSQSWTQRFDDGPSDQRPGRLERGWRRVNCMLSDVGLLCWIDVEKWLWW